MAAPLAAPLLAMGDDALRVVLLSCDFRSLRSLLATHRQFEALVDETLRSPIWRARPENSDSLNAAAWRGGEMSEGVVGAFGSNAPGVKCEISDISLDGPLAACVSSKSRHIRIWNVESMQLEHVFAPRGECQFESVALNSRRRLLAVASFNSRLVMYDLDATGAPDRAPLQIRSDPHTNQQTYAQQLAWAGDYLVGLRTYPDRWTDFQGLAMLGEVPTPTVDLCVWRVPSDNPRNATQVSHLEWDLHLDDDPKPALSANALSEQAKAALSAAAHNTFAVDKTDGSRLVVLRAPTQGMHCEVYSVPDLMLLRRIKMAWPLQNSMHCGGTMRRDDLDFLDKRFGSRRLAFSGGFLAIATQKRGVYLRSTEEKGGAWLLKPPGYEATALNPHAAIRVAMSGCMVAACFEGNRSTSSCAGVYLFDATTRQCLRTLQLPERRQPNFHRNIIIQNALSHFGYTLDLEGSRVALGVRCCPGDWAEPVVSVDGERAEARSLLVVQEAGPDFLREI